MGRLSRKFTNPLIIDKITTLAPTSAPIAYLSPTLKPNAAPVPRMDSSAGPGVAANTNTAMANVNILKINYGPSYQMIDKVCLKSGLTKYF